jgi:hypothetical protein
VGQFSAKGLAETIVGIEPNARRLSTCGIPATAEMTCEIYNAQTNQLGGTP